MNEDYLVCPKCGSKNVTVTQVQKFMVNSGEHYCHSVKTHDQESQANCLDCGWDGQRGDLLPSNAPQSPEAEGLPRGFGR